MPGDRLLVIHHGALGDLVLTFPALTALQNHGVSTIHGLCQGRLGVLGQFLGIFDQAFPLESARYAGLYAQTPPVELSGFISAFDAVLLFSNDPSIQDRLAAMIAAPVHRIPPRPPVTVPTHVTAHVFGELARCGRLPDGAHSHATATLHDRRDHHRIDPGRIWIHPGSGSARKNWPLDRFVTLHRMLSADGFRPAFILGPAEENLLNRLADLDKEIEPYLPETLTELAKLLMEGEGYVGNDSGVSHLAAFLGLPTTAVFGPTDPRRWRPVGLKVAVVQGERNDCRPCFETERENCETLACLAGVSPECVFRKVKALMCDGCGDHSICLNCDLGDSSDLHE